jgi:hypothetical protein
MQLFRGSVRTMRELLPARTLVRRLEKFLRAALAEATRKDIASVGVPAMGTGPKAIDLNAWLGAFADVAVRHLHRSEATKDEEKEQKRLAIVVVLYESADFGTTVRALNRGAWAAWYKESQPADGSQKIDLTWRQRFSLRMRSTVLPCSRLLPTARLSGPLSN